MNATTFDNNDRDTYFINAFVTRLFQSAATPATKPAPNAADLAKAYAQAFASR
jgi:hypothetical protein